ncbi:MAG: LysM peptidoglycan-binding domain-containing protein, partial [Candidatus Eisenbacteria bacterium]|nr:LysM peptidoglycan-binding domain-containing protein [Candidatus Eisenbacteria bacterium]
MSALRRFSIVLAAGWLLLAAGCAGSGGNVELPDVAQGEYLELEEQKALPGAAQERYCRMLRARLDQLNREPLRILREADSLKAMSDSLRQRVLELNKTYRSLQTQVRQLRLKEKQASTYIVREGDTLTKISSLIFGTGARWEEIYEANKTVIESPTAPLKPGTRLR